MIDGSEKLNRQLAFELQNSPASFPVVLSDFGCDVTCQACRENSPCAIALGSKPPLVTRIARTGLGTRLRIRMFVKSAVGFVGVYTKRTCVGARLPQVNESQITTF